MGLNVQLLLLLGTISAALKYKYIKQNKNWADAYSYCMRNFTALAPVNDESDMDLLQKLAGDYSGYIWFGLLRNKTDPSKFMWSEGGEVKRFFWDDNEPSNGLGDNYGVMLNYKWHDALNLHHFHFFCYSVHVVREEKTWKEALDHCRTHYTDLATISSETEMMLIQRELNKNISTAHVWMGLRYLSGQWLWMDGRVREYEAWDQLACPVNLACGALVSNGTVWEAHDCVKKLHFICY